VGSTNSEEVVAHEATLMFDIPSLFEKWCRSLDYNPASESTINFAPTESEIIFEGVLHVESLVRGNIRSAHGTLVMTQVGRVEADVDVRAAIIDGHLKGTLRATEHVVLKSNARVSGDIHTPSLTVNDGAVFEGSSYFLERDIYANLQNLEAENEALQVSAVGA
jgi:cytoskeletal protein CcmA (bactofilin family)